MNSCFKCGVSGENARLHDAISNTGIVKICENCSASERLPVIKKMTEHQMEESQRQKSVRERLTGMNNRNSLTQREVTLRDIVDRNVRAKNQPPADLIENFHWTIQRIKRARKITREEFAKAIGESEANIRMIEQGFLPNNDYKIINKIESYLRVSLRKAGTSGFPDTSMRTPEKRFVLDNSLIEKEKKEEAPKKLSFRIPDSKQLKISDVKEIKRRQEEGKNQSDDVWEEEYSQDDEKFLDEPEDFDEDE